MVRIASVILAFAGIITCVISTLAFLPLALWSPFQIEAVDQITSHAMTAGLALSALGGLGLLITEVVSELSPA